MKEKTISEGSVPGKDMNNLYSKTQDNLRSTSSYSHYDNPRRQFFIVAPFSKGEH